MSESAADGDRKSAMRLKTEKRRIGMCRSEVQTQGKRHDG
jgi:hypothetical protein